MNFDQPLQIDHTGESKYNSDTLKAIYGNEVLSFWMAETDFPCPPNISKALKQMTEKGSYTYQYKTESLKNSICAWFKMRHGLKMEVPKLLFTSGVMTGIAAAIDVFSNIGDGIIIQPPVYHEFKSTIVDAKREVVKNSLIENESGYKIDFEDLEKKAADGKNRILLLCSPHNPVGRVWSKDEMLNIVEICKKTDTLLLSDEIHADIILEGHSFTSAISLSGESDNIIMFGSPGKTFGIPGISDAFVYTDDEQLYDKMKVHIHRYHLLKSNAFTNVATEAGYTHDGPWLDELLSYVEGNIGYIRGYLSDNIPQIKINSPEGTYQAWLDFRGLGIDVHELRKLLAKAGIGLNAGYGYGREGAGFARMNIACPRIFIEEGMHRINKAINK